MPTVRTHSETYRDYALSLTEWCGSWQGTAFPLASGLRSPAPEQIVDAARPTLDAALTAYRELIDRLHPPPKSWAEILKSS